MKRLITATAIAGTLALSMSHATAFADHDHDLVTPGTVVVDIGNGQTEKCADDPGGHKFHVNVHTGTPGSFAFIRPNNPINVVKTENASC